MKGYGRKGLVLLLISLLLVGCIGGGSKKEYGISGTVKDFDGNGIEGVKLELRKERQSLGAVETDEHGRWQAKAPKGSVIVTPVKELWEFDPPNPSVIVNKKTAQTDFTGIQNLILHIDGEGTVGKNIISATEIDLKATATKGWKFARWEISSLLDSTKIEYSEQSRITVDLKEPKKVKAIFEALETTLSGTVRLIHSFPYSVEEETASIYGAKSQTAGTRSFTKQARTNAYRPQYKANELIVRYDHYDYDTQSAELEAAGYKILDTIEVLNAYLVETNKSPTLLEMHLKGVASVEQNGMKYTSALNIPNDELYFAQWHYNQIRLPQAWAVTTGDRSIRIAVVDTGVATEHPDLKENLDLDYAADFTSERTVEDYDGHGTHVAGTIGAVSNNGELLAGVMWDVELLPVKVFDAKGETSTWTIVNGMLYAAGLLNQEGKPFNPYPADIINMSFGGGYSGFERDAVEQIYASGVIMVAAAGNEGLPIVSYPAAYPEVIAVGAVGQVVKNDPNGFTEPPLAGYSNYGAEIDVVAPGGAGRLSNDFVWSTYPPAIHPTGGLYMGMGGTSMASPHVAGVVGLMLSNGIPKDTEIIRDILRRTSMEIDLDGANHYYGHGLINAYWAVNNVEEMRIIQGIRDGNKIVDIASEVSIEPKGGSFAIELVPGEYNLIAWVDVNKNNIIDAGDYYDELGMNIWPDTGAYGYIFEATEVAVGQFE